ncbi:flagellar hook-length control protein FliK [Brevibacillus brevis]|uniref:Flagellar hook-length control protein FliK n=1 Tax=Brevibacillus brevis TaxID=1393 RepID=A0ABY9SXH9_BREBE|nr:flagellar hook-length control protein FliK [Brevibacillus brevis]WNC12541.1 flagellar hook-length control protein FliK [Brevibacillus brevis]
MNVASVTTSVGVGSGATATAGTATGGAGLGDLFSMQMIQALQSLPDPDATLAPEGLSEDDMDALQELMALLAQMLSSGEQLPQELGAALEDKAGAVDQLLQKAQSQFPGIQEDWKQLMTKLSEGEPASAEMEKLAELLEALKNQKGSQETGKKSPLLARSEVTGGPQVQPELEKSVQPLRFHQGLSAYKAEAGIPSQTVQPSLQGSGLSNQNGNEESSQPFANAQGTVATPTPQQTNQTLPQPSVPAHQVHASQVTQQVTQIFVKQMKLSQVEGVHEAKLILNPQSLGQVDVTIKSHNGVITAHFSAETQAGKDLLDNQLPQLRAALAQQGLQVDRLEVSQQQETAFSFQGQRDQARQQQENKREAEQQQDQEFALDALVDNTESTESLWNRLRETAQGIGDIV